MVKMTGGHISHKAVGRLFSLSLSLGCGAWCFCVSLKVLIAVKYTGHGVSTVSARTFG